ncbi:MAG TPA: trehalose-6-phosphate synthase [Candidatus Nanoarchaeia archaeon]|nr:trehalose-6-phosphate synthase [Candidatus Nanoarchaeia archaeon]
MRKRRMVVVSNRLPVTLHDGPDGFEVQASSGGLVSALLPIFREMGGSWIGWPGVADCSPEVSEVLKLECGPTYSFEAVALSAKDRAMFYHGCSNEIIWPLFHDLQSRCRFDPAFWDSYTDVNTRFADSVQAITTQHDFVWVHDYHLMMVAAVLRERGSSVRLGYFHHIPFPSPDIFEKLPWRKQILEGLLSFNTVGFQSDRDRRNFVACAQRQLGKIRLQRTDNLYRIEFRGQSSTLGTFPISIDFDAWSQAARQPTVTEFTRDIRNGSKGRQLIVGIDRLDYTKGIPERLLAFAALLRDNPGRRKRVSLIQVAVPSREEIENYSDLRAQIERRVGEINGTYGSTDWCPVTYMHRSLAPEELLALYRAADVMLVTPLKDGMNLVAKEFCAARNDHSGVLILSEFAGAAAELRCGALLINPYDSHSICSALTRAMQMDRLSRAHRMRHMRDVIRKHDVYAWRDKFLAAAIAEDNVGPSAVASVHLPEEDIQQLSARAI